MRPTEKPSMRPTEDPSMRRPTEEPSMRPTEDPSMRPTDPPTMPPTEQPSMGPTDPLTVDISRILQDLNEAVKQNLITQEEKVAFKKSLFQSFTTDYQISLMARMWGYPTTPDEILLSIQEVSELLN